VLAHLAPAAVASNAGVAVAFLDRKRFGGVPSAGSTIIRLASSRKPSRGCKCGLAAPLNESKGFTRATNAPHYTTVQPPLRTNLRQILSGG